MRHILNIFLFVFFSVSTYGQVKFGNYGIGSTIGIKNNFTFRAYPKYFVKEKNSLSIEVQYSHAIYISDFNKFYAGVGIGNTWVNLRELQNGGINSKGIIINDYKFTSLYIPLGCEFFPITNNNKISCQIESGPQLGLSRLELNPNRTLNYFYNIRGVIEVNYYFNRKNNYNF
jgi:hypothetical protein